MKISTYSICFLVVCFLSLSVKAQVGNGISVSFSPVATAFPLVTNGGAVSVYYDEGEEQVVKTAASAFCNDVKLISGILPSLGKSLSSEFQIIIGTEGRSKALDALIANKKLSLSDIKGKWETFSISVVENPFPTVKKALVIAGSDKRGTAFGVFELSRLIGVHPFYWWADIHPKQQIEIFISGSMTSNPPSVKYRGIFLNDEDWGLQPWAAKTFEPETGDIGPKTYSKIFELLLRLKANLIWPAMHPSTKAFYHYPGNKKVAEDYGIIVGSSHAEPMLRNNVGEWDKKTMGSFNYLTNKENVFSYWESRVKESISNDAIYTLGMRGVHDSGIEGVKSTKEAIPLVERIITDQRNLLKKYHSKDIASIPQAFTAYKEVLEIYDGGLKLPEDITLVWPDDNYGYIHRLNNEQEKERSGGSGVYYHASYWGRPHDYLWLSSTHPALIREEMMKARLTKSDKLWVLNVGDIKPLEYNINMFLDMAYDVAPFEDPQYSKIHLTDWVEGIFGEDKAQAITSTLWKYYDLAFERRPEFMGWSQTEPTTQTKYSDYNHFYYNDEAERRMLAYSELEQKVKEMRSDIADQKSAFYQLVYYPVVGASQINKKFLYRDKSYLYAKQNRASAQDYALWSNQAYEAIQKETEFYNNQLSTGKWKHMMSMEPRSLPVFKAPVLSEIKIDKSSVWGIAPEGMVTKDSSLVSETSVFVLPAFNRLIHKEYFIDVFLSDDQKIEWNAESKAKWLKLSEASGILMPETGRREKRIWVSIDWEKAPQKEELETAILFKGKGGKFIVAVKAQSPKVQSGDINFVDDNGVVSILAPHYSRISDASKWTKMDGLGQSGNALMSSIDLNEKIPNLKQPDNLKETAAVIEYDFYSFSTANPEVKIFTLPTHPVNNNYSMRYGVSVDNGSVKILDFKTVGRSQEWKQNVLSNTAVRKFNAEQITPGKHTLKIYRIDPGVILDRIVIDLGGLKPAYSTIPETKK